MAGSSDEGRSGVDAACAAERPAAIGMLDDT
jgi:hypothetical protein